MYIFCEKIIGHLNDPQMDGVRVDYVDIEWHEACKKLHHKTTRAGTVLRVSLDNAILTRGLRQGDVLAVNGGVVVAVNIAPCNCLVLRAEENGTPVDINSTASQIDSALIQVAYELGNRHVPLFWGTRPGELLTPYEETLARVLQKLPGVMLEQRASRPDFGRRLGMIEDRHGPDHGAV